MRKVYLDNHSCTKIDERVLAEMLPFLKEEYGNAQSMHALGAKAKDALEKARSQAASLIGVKAEEIYFASCGSEANNLAVKGVAQAYAQKGRHVVVSGIEHFSVLYAARRLSQQGFEVTYIPVDKYGAVSPEDVKRSVRKDTVLVSVQHANPEIGTVQLVEEISKIVHGQGAVFHTDAVCTAGIVPVDAGRFGADLLTFSGSQFHGPRGAAALYVKKGVKIVPQIDGGIQEGGRRAGTENIPAIAGFGKACEIAAAEMEGNIEKMILLRDKLINGMREKIEYIYLNGHPEKRLPNNVNFSVEFIEGEGMMLLLDEAGICVSSGSACASKALKMSHILTAICVDAAVGQGSVLMTLSKYNTAEDVDYVLAEFPPIVKKLRDMSPLYAYFKKTGNRQVAGPGTDYDHKHKDEN
ncbi:cysteine desulfurase NifS [Candidatus Desantisbacteria bacterium CG_4_10_14_0_8_um_filter_48_22]|uniref:Cysteine desulfurase NifS n=1 Tax=Candidatus Desantisbacteria bacterium CG_4_10_14_0_8_um_filter_48_22 TaxID=1974543 RepID=A0A2M7SDK7_9BACT|nr:MAG: cysteine desulfurase NifS [Candidatus Desantisbacteria bacterium CG1_02_49_89]PIV57353.1 MAG: cysteine desulfurase NifS [Candidatus Desantisbacteria bacterium CG02_land_8_20_14_3_00_49_13]PIZ17615.1 MAG: cysteine desulfurase NifS [Candidatus Desantisbacteria bacterium CG_4_10_14_0_8_um_filter_48_22]PJB28380.1 MAG: cysteine desulfurase NifS [Candidatus Desantisbacteria bacterium CG_4_9_14_3_um_filter_50_7]